MKTDDPKILAEQYGYQQADFQSAIDEALFSARARREANRIFKAEELPPQTMPECVPLSERLLKPRPAKKFRIEGWQGANHRVVLAAQFKAGKTTLTGNLVRSLVDGDRFLTRAKVKPISGCVTILDFEMDETDAEDWLNAQGIKNADKVNLVSLRGRASTFNILDVGVRREWEALLAEHQTDYLILDCLRPALDALGLDEHKDAGRFLGPLDALLIESGVSEALVVHHMGHGGERGRGDSRLRDWPDVEWRLVRENEHPDSTRYITAFGRDVDVKEHKLTFDRKTRHLIGSPGDRGDVDADNALNAVLSVLETYGDAMSGRAIEGALKEHDHGRKAIRGALRLGVRRGLVDTQGGTHNSINYALPRGWARRMRGGEGDAELNVSDNEGEGD